MAAFKQGLKEQGYIDSQNVAIEYRATEGQYDPLPALVADLVCLQVAVISSSALAAALTFTTATDPVKDGLVASLNRPGGNPTGVSLLTGELVQKRLELLREVLPNIANSYRESQGRNRFRCGICHYRPDDRLVGTYVGQILKGNKPADEVIE